MQTFSQNTLGQAMQLLEFEHLWGGKMLSEEDFFAIFE